MPLRPSFGLGFPHPYVESTPAPAPPPSVQHVPQTPTSTPTAPQATAPAASIPFGQWSAGEKAVQPVQVNSSPANTQAVPFGEWSAGEQAVQLAQPRNQSQIGPPERPATQPPVNPQLPGSAQSVAGVLGPRGQLIYEQPPQGIHNLDRTPLPQPLSFVGSLSHSISPNEGEGFFVQQGTPMVDQIIASNNSQNVAQQQYQSAYPPPTQFQNGAVHQANPGNQPPTPPKAAVVDQARDQIQKTYGTTIPQGIPTTTGGSLLDSALQNGAALMATKNVLQKTAQFLQKPPLIGQTRTASEAFGEAAGESEALLAPEGVVAVAGESTSALGAVSGFLGDAAAVGAGAVGDVLAPIVGGYEVGRGIQHEFKDSNSTLNQLTGGRFSSTYGKDIFTAADFQKAGIQKDPTLQRVLQMNPGKSLDTALNDIDHFTGTIGKGLEAIPFVKNIVDELDKWL